MSLPWWRLAINLQTATEMLRCASAPGTTTLPRCLVVRTRAPHPRAVVSTFVTLPHEQQLLALHLVRRNDSSAATGYYSSTSSIRCPSLTCILSKYPSSLLGRKSFPSLAPPASSMQSFLGTTPPDHGVYASFSCLRSTSILFAGSRHRFG